MNTATAQLPELQAAIPMPEESADSPCGKAAGRPRASDLEARLNSLIETAGCLFLNKGYTKVSLEMIAREAHVAVRTIYVKFGGKAGLFKAVLVANRARFFADMDAMEHDPRPVREVVNDFAQRFLALISAPDALSMQRMVIAEAHSNPELAHTFFEAGPRETRAVLARYFARADVRAQLREGIPLAPLPVHLLNCVMGDQLSRFLLDTTEQAPQEMRRDLEERMNLFFHSVLRQP